MVTGQHTPNLASEPIPQNSQFWKQITTGIDLIQPSVKGVRQGNIAKNSPK